MNQNRQNGFTIIELLVVVIVIAILATVSVFAYNGIRARTENAKTISGVATFIKAMGVYKGTYNTYPTDTSYPCIGDVPTSCGVTPSSSCWGITTVAANNTINTEIRKIQSAVPTVSKQAMSCTTNATASGAFFYTTPTVYYVWYFLKGDTDCKTPNGVTFGKSFSVDATLCSATIN